jgi:hypothetical protein
VEEEFNVTTTFRRGLRAVLMRFDCNRLRTGSSYTQVPPR